MIPLSHVLLVIHVLLLLLNRVLSNDEAFESIVHLIGLICKTLVVLLFAKMEQRV